jgi:hypothetical protein
MADRTDYTKLLGERLERAYRAKDDIKPPSAEDIARWKRLAQAKRKEKRKRMKLIASLASVFAVAFCVSIVPMFKIPDAQAGEDYFVDLETLENDEESMMVDTYHTYDDVPEDVKEEFLFFEKLPEGYSLSEVKIITIGKNRGYESQFKSKNNNLILIRQNNSNDNSEVIVSSDYVQNWYGLDIYVEEYTSDKKVNYKFTMNNMVINIMTEDSIDEEEIKIMIKEAIF